MGELCASTEDGALLQGGMEAVNVRPNGGAIRNDCFFLFLFMKGKGAWNLVLVLG